MLDQEVVSAFTPMLAQQGSVGALKARDWAFEGKFDGYRLLMEVDYGNMTLRSRRSKIVTKEYPGFKVLATALADHQVVLDGEAVALDDDGVPGFNLIQNRARATRVQYWIFDLLYLDGRSLLRFPYRDRRKLLEKLVEGTELIVPELLPGDGADALERARQRGWEGVVAKDLGSTYHAGKRSPLWIKDKFWNAQEVVIAGWRVGDGRRAHGIGSLLMGIPRDGGLQFAGRVGTGFTERALEDLKELLEPLHTAESPFNGPLPPGIAKGVTFVKPVLVGEVQYAERTSDGSLRQPSWRGLRPDKVPEEVRYES